MRAKPSPSIKGRAPLDAGSKHDDIAFGKQPFPTEPPHTPTSRPPDRNRRPSRRKRKPTAQYANLSSPIRQSRRAQPIPQPRSETVCGNSALTTIAEMDATQERAASQRHVQRQSGSNNPGGFAIAPTLGQGLGVQPFCSGREYCGGQPISATDQQAPVKIAKLGGSDPRRSVCALSDDFIVGQSCIKSGSR